MNAPADRSDLAAGRERTRRRRERIAIGVVAALIVGLTLIEARIAALGGSVAFSSNIVIFALININVILIVLLIYLVTRNIFKLILDRKRDILGAKIRSRLVIIFIAFSLLPTILLFVAAANITTTSIKLWIGERVGIALSGALDIARKDLDTQAGSLAPVAAEAALAVPPRADPFLAGRVLEESLRKSGARGGLLLVESGNVLAAAGKVPPDVTKEIVSRIRGTGGPGSRGGGATMVGPEFVSATRRMSDGRIVVAVRVLPPAEAARNRGIAQVYDAFHQVRLLDDPIRASYLTILALITLLIVFAASWMGIYLARQITVPVQLLAEGTEKVAMGDLDVRLDYRSDDEFGTLVSSFNRMTADLREMKRSLTEANVSLSATYEELSRRTQFTEAILDNISTGIVFVDRNGKIAVINPVASRLLGIAAAEAIGKSYKDVVREEHYGIVRALLREIQGAPGTPVERQVAMPVAGREISLRLSVIALPDDAGEYRGIVVAFDDLTQAMRLQKVMAWREVARRIAHEIRNPLTPIQLSAERLGKRYGELHGGEQAFSESIRTILDEVGTLKHLVEEFTRFARMPAPVLKEGRLSDLLRPLVETYRASYPGIRWLFEDGGAPPASFDPFQVRRAVSNLLDNAAAALKGSGTVSVRLGHEPDLGVVRIAVADDGPGIPPEDRDRLFEPYFSRKEGGTGLGLAIVSAIASDHRGTVRIRRNVPRGAIFEMEFPAHPKGRG
ncbi:MAG: ATP-binding protein [Deltaproteobacteria bacterium]|nr:ATP-binding protein [Deltaproteobacteria bacterium]